MLIVWALNYIMWETLIIHSQFKYILNFFYLIKSELWWYENKMTPFYFSLRMCMSSFKFSLDIKSKITTQGKNIFNTFSSLLQIQFCSSTTEKHWANQSRQNSLGWALEMKTWRRLHHQQLHTLTSHLRIRELQLPESRQRQTCRSHLRKVSKDGAF